MSPPHIFKRHFALIRLHLHPNLQLHRQSSTFISSFPSTGTATSRVSSIHSFRLGGWEIASGGIGSIKRYCITAVGGGVAGGRTTAFPPAYASPFAPRDDMSRYQPKQDSGYRGLDSEAGVGLWSGRAVFINPSAGHSSPDYQNQAGRFSAGLPQSSGTINSPISITSSPSSTSSSSQTPSPEPFRQPSTPLSRPRAVASYSTAIARTAYTPPRSSPARQSSTPAGQRIQVHPFFNQTFARSKSTPMPHTPPPPSSQRPRFVAHYSSTSESQGSTAGASSTFGSQNRERDQGREVQASPSRVVQQGWNRGMEGQGKERGTPLSQESNVDDLADHVKKIDLTGKFKPNPADPGEGWKPYAKGDWKGKGKGKVNAPNGGIVPDNGYAGHAAQQGGSLARYGRPTQEGKPPYGSKSNLNPNTLPFPQSTSTANGSAYLRQVDKPPPVARYPSQTGTDQLPSKAPARKSKPAPPVEDPIDPKDYFRYTDYSPTPEVIYTTSLPEADELLSRLQGEVLGLDLEWPMAGWYKGPDGKKFQIGMTWNETAKKWDFGQGRTALIQICDEKLIILIHLKEGNNMVLPRKLIEIVQDKDIYKCGVNIKGDGQKLRRDFPTAWPLGINSLLELTHVARRVDPVGTGPGSVLISLAKLTKAYTGKWLEKDPKVRKSNWLFDLGDKQIQYAANDTYAGLQIYLTLKSMAQEKDINIDLDQCSSGYRPDGKSQPSTKIKDPTAIPTPHVNSEEQKLQLAPGFTKYPPPRQETALINFTSGMDLMTMATEGGIKPATVEGYICDALAVLVDDTLTPEEMRRLVPQIKDIRVRIRFKRLIARLRRGSGEEEVDSDVTMSDVEEDEVKEMRLSADGEEEATDELVDVFSRVTIEKEVVKVAEIDHGWTKEEMEAACMLSDSEECGR